MLSVPHMIVVFLVVLVVFGPQKLPELARGLGKLMAEFRKASTDFKGAFEEEMRDLERQARVAELRKKNAEAESAEARAKEMGAVPATLAAAAVTTATEYLPETASEPPLADGPVIKPVAEAVARLDASNGETVAPAAEQTIAEHKPEGSAAENPPSHDQQQPA
jgi:sec-independent protein translocase protein TatB